MELDVRRHLPLLAGAGLLIAAVGLVVPWWTGSFEAGGFEAQSPTSPFNPGPGADETAVTIVGILDVVGLIGAIGGLVLWLRSGDEPELADRDPASWLWLGSGGFLLVAALSAALTWPENDLGFWSSSGGSTFAAGTGADIGWYLTILAGALIAAAGIAWLVQPESVKRGEPEQAG